MAFEEKVNVVSMVAGADLSAKQFYFVTNAADGQVDPTGDGLLADGVLYNDPDAAGKVAEVAIGGVVKVVSGGSVTRGALIASTAAGKATVAATGDVVLGRALEAGATDGDVIAVLFNPSYILV